MGLLNDSSKLNRSVVFCIGAPLGLSLTGLAATLSGRTDVGFWTSMSGSFAFILAMIIVTVVITSQDSRFRKGVAQGAETLASGQVAGQQATGRLVRTRPKGSRIQAPTLPQGPALTHIGIFNALLPEGPRRVAAFIPPMPKGTVLPLWVHPHEREVALADLQPQRPAAGPPPPTEPTDSQVAGGYGVLVVFALLGILLGGAVTGLVLVL